MQTPTTATQSRVSFIDFVDLACEKVGGAAIATNDDFFAEKENLVKAATPVFIADKYTDRGKWMDGWESRRKRNLSAESHDWCIVKLGLAGAIQGVNVDTAFFTGNYPEYCALDATCADAGATAEQLSKAAWKEILPKSPLAGGTSNYFGIGSRERYTHVRLRIFPDGGVARLRVHGEVLADLAKLKAAGKSADLAALENGGVVVACNDNFFGPKDNLIQPGRAKTMGDGWETRRKRGPGHDWIIVRLAATGTVSKIEVDTNHFKGNFPDMCSIEGCLVEGAGLLVCDFRDRGDIAWTELLPRTRLSANTQHYFEKELTNATRKFNYVRLNIYPDGGVSRLRVHGTPA